MAIFNLRHRLAALSAWALALALALGAALPQPAQATGPETGGYAQMRRPAMSSFQTPDLSFRASSRMPTLDFRPSDQYTFRGCPPGSPLFACLHPDDDRPAEVCKAATGMAIAVGSTGVLPGQAIGGAVGGAIGGPAGAAGGAAIGGYVGGGIAAVVGSIAGSRHGTMLHNSDGHHPAYASPRRGGKYWSCPGSED